MTFTELRAEIMDRLNLSSPEASTRIGRAINRKYRRITTSIGLQLSRRTTVQQLVTISSAFITLSNVEKVISVTNKNTTPYRQLTEVTIEELRAGEPYSLGDTPTMYSINSIGSDFVVIEINRIPQTAYALYADVHQAVVDLSGTNEPAFPESYHDVLIEGVISDELRKMEKPALAGIAESEFTRILSDLRMWIAKGGPEIYQGKTSTINRAATAGASSGGGSTSGASSYTQTGLITFDRDPLAPYVVTSGSAKVTNLDADKLDGLDSTAFAQIAQPETITGAWTFDRDPLAPFVVTSSSAKVTNLDADKLDGLDGAAYAQIAAAEVITGAWSFTIPPTGINASSVLESQVFS